jgi:hypothetical protein
VPMSTREFRLSSPSLGAGSSYHSIRELVQDKDQIESFAKALDVSRRNIHKDDCGQWTISGKRGHVQTWSDMSSYLLFVTTYSARKWGAIKRKAKGFGWELTQDGDDEGCFRLGLPDKAQSEFLRELLGLRRKRQPSSAEIINNEGISAP